MVSVLKLDALQTPSGQQIMTFGAGGLVDFDGSFQPSGFNFPSWYGAGGRPLQPPIGAMGINTGYEPYAIDVYLGLNPQTQQPSWLTIQGRSVN